MQPAVASLDNLFLIACGVVISLATVIFLCSVVFAILVGIRYLIAFVFYPRFRGCCKIVSKRVEPSYVGYTGMMYAVSIPAKYYLSVSIEDKEPEKAVKYALYESVNLGKEVNIIYSFEPFSHMIFLWKIWE